MNEYVDRVKAKTAQHMNEQQAQFLNSWKGALEGRVQLLREKQKLLDELKEVLYGRGQLNARSWTVQYSQRDKDIMQQMDGKLHVWLRDIQQQEQKIKTLYDTLPVKWPLRASTKYFFDVINPFSNKETVKQDTEHGQSEYYLNAAVHALEMTKKSITFMLKQDERFSKHAQEEARLLQVLERVSQDSKMDRETQEDNTKERTKHAFEIEKLYKSLKKTIDSEIEETLKMRAHAQKQHNKLKSIFQYQTTKDLSKLAGVFATVAGISLGVLPETVLEDQQTTLASINAIAGVVAAAGTFAVSMVIVSGTLSKLKIHSDLE